MKQAFYNTKGSFIFIPILLITVMFMILFYYYENMNASDNVQLRSKFDLHVKEIEVKIKLRMRAYVELLYAARGLFEASERIRQNEFKIFFDNLNIDKSFPGVQGLGYAVVVAPEKKDHFIQSARELNMPDFKIKPDFKRDYYTAIYFLEPLDWRNQRAIGYDMYSDPIRQKAMQLSRDQATAVMSGKVTLVQETKKDVQAGFLVYLPLYKKRAPIQTVMERRANIKGWIYAAFRADDFFHGLQGYNETFFDIELYDDSVANKGNLLLDTKPDTNGKYFKKSVPIEVAGRHWFMVIKSTKEFELDHIGNRLKLIFIFGFMMSFIFAFFVGHLLYRKNHIEYEMLQMNKKLSESGKELQEFNTKLEQKVDEKTLALEESNVALQSHIKDLERMNSRLNDARADALQAAQARSNFISGVSHELRTPLNAIINFTDQVIEDFDPMLKDISLQEETKLFLDRVMINSRHLLQLINDLLEFTKAEAGKMDYEIQAHDLNMIIINAYNSTYSLLQGLDVEMKLNLSTEPMMAEVDARRFLQILLNLLSNAIKFTEKGWIEIRSLKRDDRLVVEIEDTGRGIAMKKQAFIFDPFIQVNSHDPGTGLGLGLVKRMCDDMGISIFFTSVENKGSIFRLEFNLDTTGINSVLKLD